MGWRRFQFCIWRFQSVRRLFLQLCSFVILARSRARSTARPCTISCGLAASELLPFPGADFNLFKPLRRHFRATPFCRRDPSRRDPGDRARCASTSFGSRRTSAINAVCHRADTPNITFIISITASIVSPFHPRLSVRRERRDARDRRKASGHDSTSCAFSERDIDEKGRVDFACARPSVSAPPLVNGKILG